MAVTLSGIPTTVDQLNSMKTSELRNALANQESPEVEVFLKTFSYPRVSPLTFKLLKKITKALPPSTPHSAYSTFFEYHIYHNPLKGDWEPVFVFFRSCVVKNHQAAELLVNVIPDSYSTNIPVVVLEEQLLEAFERRAFQKMGADTEVDNAYISALINWLGKISWPSYWDPLISTVCRWGTLDELNQLCDIYKERNLDANTYLPWAYLPSNRLEDTLLDYLSNQIEKLKVLIGLLGPTEQNQHLNAIGGILILKSLEGSPTKLDAMIKYLKINDISVSEKIKVTLNQKGETALHIAIRKFGPGDLRVRLLKLQLSNEDLKQIFDR